MAMLIRVFVDASPHIPEHRQLPLFAHLIGTVGSTQFLHTVIILLLEKHVVHAPNTSDDKQVLARLRKESLSTPILSPPPSLPSFALMENHNITHTLHKLSLLKRSPAVLRFKARVVPNMYIPLLVFVSLGSIGIWMTAHLLLP